jgi:hypothetical protein
MRSSASRKCSHKWPGQLVEGRWHERQGTPRKTTRFDGGISRRCCSCLRRVRAVGRAADGRHAELEGMAKRLMRKAATTELRKAARRSASASARSSPARTRLAASVSPSRFCRRPTIRRSRSHPRSRHRRKRSQRRPAAPTGGAPAPLPGGQRAAVGSARTDAIAGATPLVPPGVAPPDREGQDEAAVVSLWGGASRASTEASPREVFGTAWFRRSARTRRKIRETVRHADQKHRRRPPWWSRHQRSQPASFA